jgi:hypothetical protein
MAWVLRTAIGPPHPPLGVDDEPGGDPSLGARSPVTRNLPADPSSEGRRDAGLGGSIVGGGCGTIAGQESTVVPEVMPLRI